jgi:pilus assembly protein CpaB
LLRVAAWPGDIIPSKAAANSKELEGRVTQTIIAKGEPVLLTKLAPEGTAAGLGGLLDPDRLAVTVKTDEVSGVGGFVSPGDRVDVLVEMASSGESNEHYSKLILQNLKVLSKGQVWDQTTDKKPQVVQTVTLEVSADQAEVLNLASFQGRIRLALRNQRNQENFSTSGVATSQLCNRPAVKAKALAATAPEPKDQTRSIQVIKGMDITETTFKSDPGYKNKRKPLTKYSLAEADSKRRY